jgi:RNA polymerase sigma-70 factor (ECF subfamily)
VALRIDDFDPIGPGAAEGTWDAAHDAAFQDAYERYHDRIYRFCRFRLGDSYEAEDVAQETFARAWKDRSVLFQEQRLYPWLRVVAANLCTDQLRRRNRCQPNPEIDPGTVDRTEEQVIGAGDVQMLRQAMGRLNERHRTALEQRESAGWTYEQMAAHSGTTIASVESLLWRARQALKREFVAIAGPDGVLAGVPVIGLIVRKLHRARMRLAGWASRSGGVPELAGGNAVVASVLGSATAACLAGVGSLLAPAASVATVSTVPAAVTASPAPAPASGPGPASLTLSAAAGASGGAGGPAGGRAGPSHPIGAFVAAQGLNRPVDVVHSQQREQALPDQVSVSGLGGTDALGVSPENTMGWAQAFVTHRLSQPLGAATP